MKYLGCRNIIVIIIILFCLFHNAARGPRVSQMNRVDILFFHTTENKMFDVGTFWIIFSFLCFTIIERTMILSKIRLGMTISSKLLSFQS